MRKWHVIGAVLLSAWCVMFWCGVSWASADKAEINRFYRKVVETLQEPQPGARSLLTLVSENRALAEKVLRVLQEKAAASGENYEWTEMYPSFAQIADDEGLVEIAQVFRDIAVAEKQHERCYLGLLKNVRDGKAFRKDNVVKWRCRNCGYIHEGNEAPDTCPACDHPQAHYELLAENW